MKKREIMMRVATFVAVVAILAIAFVCTWQLSDLCNITYNGLTYLEAQAHAIEKFGVPATIVLDTLFVVCLSEAFYQYFRKEENT